jgi:hypothetical protein
MSAMTEAEWLACTDPVPMLAFLRGRLTDRKIRLLAVACCRRIWHLLADKRSRSAVEVAEQFADGQLTIEDLQAAHESARTANNECVEAVWDARSSDFTEFRLAWEAAHAIHESVGWCSWSEALPETWVSAANNFDAMTAAMRGAREAAARAATSNEQATVESFEGRAQVSVLRDIVGNPSCPRTVNRAWSTWNECTVTRIARSIYDERAFDRMPILADALEDAGCNDADILAHCRGPGPHVRGCWVVDLILGKK